MGKQWGKPIIAVRMPRVMIAGLQILARQTGTSSSEVIRQLVADELRRQHIQVEHEQLEGQLSI